MKKEELFEAIGAIDERYAADLQNHRKISRLAKQIGGIAACIAIAAFSVFDASENGRNIPLSDASENVTAKYIDALPDQGLSSAPDLAFLTPEEIFGRADTVIFQGSVSEIRNIVLDFNGEKVYQAIALIQVEKTYRGDLTPGEMLTVLLPCPILEDFWMEDTDTVSRLRTGMRGIFMPCRYDENHFCIRNNATLMYRDIADYGFWDGARWAFLETPEGLAYCEWTYGELSLASSLADVEEYVCRMLGQQ